MSECQNGKIQVKMMRTEAKGKKGRTANWNIVITILQCAIVNVKRIHIVVAASLISALLCFLNAAVHLR